MSSPWSTAVTRLRRTDVDREYQLWVDVPPRYHADGDPHDLILCLDAIWTYGTVVDAVRIQSLSKMLPRAVVAGVAYDTSDLKEVTQLRAMDLTTTAVDAPPMTGVRVPGTQLGGAEPFRVWLAETVLPLLRADYNIGDVTLVGHSFSALFGVHCLLDTPEMFDHYVLASPSVWWDDQVMFRREEAYAATHDDLAAHVFMSNGSEETDDFSPHKEFHDQLAGRNHPGLDLTWAQFEGEHHISVVSAAVNRGLRALLGPDPAAG